MNSKLANIANALTVLTIALALNACAVSGSNHANKTDRYLDETRVLICPRFDGHLLT